MKKWMLVAILVLLPVSAWAIEVNLVGVVQDGRIRSTANYYAMGGANPFYENRYISAVSASGTAGIALQTAFSGAVVTKEQIEVQTGWGSFSTRVGADSLVNVKKEDTEITTGTLVQSAIGFSGGLKSGMVTMGFDSTVFTGIAEALMVGTLNAGGMKVVTVGTSETPPQTTEYYKGFWAFGPGQVQGKIEIIFPK